ncbi:MAG: GGDEF domain-containing protein [Desulfovibrionaceae bacterium]|nr:GGDEF domain-containing protein [Desulfovibrionaceae bacterium]
MSLKTKLILAISILLTSTFLATSLINYAVTRKTLREELLRSSLPLTGKNIYSEIQGSMMRPILVSTSMATDTFLKDWVRGGERDLSKIRNYLSEIKKRYGFLTTFFVSVASGKYYNEDGVFKTVGARDPRDVWFFAFGRTGKEYDLNVDLSEDDDDTLSIFVNCRVEDAQGRLLGVTGAGVNLGLVASRLKEARKRYAREIYLMDQDGVIQVHRDPDRIGCQTITRTGGICDVAGAILDQKSVDSVHEYDWQGSHHLLSVHYIPELEWYLIVDQDEAGVMKSARNSLIHTLVAGGCVSALVILLCVVTINYFQNRLEDLAQIDPLTNAANRHALEKRYARSAYRAERYGRAFSVIIIDLNKFKEINDTYGHIAGDAVLKRVAETIAASIRPSDLLARWGGDEFIILMDGGEQDARNMAKRILAAVSDASADPPVTFSYGLAEYRSGDDLNSLTMRADKLLYKAKDED